MRPHSPPALSNRIKLDHSRKRLPRWWETEREKGCRSGRSRLQKLVWQSSCKITCGRVCQGLWDRPIFILGVVWHNLQGESRWRALPLAFLSLPSLSLPPFPPPGEGGALNKIGRELGRDTRPRCGLPGAVDPAPRPPTALRKLSLLSFKSPRKCIHEIVSLFFLSAASAFFAYLL